MRLSFANGEHADFIMDGSAVSLGNADGNTLVLHDRDVAAWHARVTVDPRGIVLEVLDPSARTHVNARPVREKALLRCGDVLCLGKVVVNLKADSDDLIETDLPPEAPATPPPAQPARVILRGVSGSHFGKTIAVNPRLVIGRDPACGLVIDDARIAARHVAIENVGDAIYLRDIAAPNGSSVNGVQIDSAIVYPGDQLAFERSHFIIEAPGLPLRGEDRAAADQLNIGPADVERSADAAAESPQAQGAIWWLIGAAALIALGLVLLIHRGI
ncbi:FHA domain-containing protein [Dokdonella soli]|uniref:FHA domain-containing protein n=1 Tax=Dokdonella soli TaxID=529810 RepID=A0ABP3TLM6_9GAMM